MKYLYTEITTWIGERQIVGYNIGGFTCCRMDDLAEAFAETYVWDPATITLNMTTKAENSAEAGTSEQDLTSDKAEEALADEAEHVPAAEAFVAEYIQSLQDAMRFQIRGNADEPLYIAQKAVLDSFTYSILSYVSVPERSSRTKTVYIELQPAGYGSYTLDPGILWNSLPPVNINVHVGRGAARRVFLHGSAEDIRFARRTDRQLFLIS